MDARFGYLINENDAGYRPDSLNHRGWWGRSVAELPDAPDEPWIHEIPGVPKGTVTKEIFKSEILKENRTISIYVPAGYAASEQSFNLLVLLDGES